MKYSLGNNPLIKKLTIKVHDYQKYVKIDSPLSRVFAQKALRFFYDTQNNMITILDEQNNEDAEATQAFNNQQLQGHQPQGQQPQVQAQAQQRREFDDETDLPENWVKNIFILRDCCYLRLYEFVQIHDFSRDSNNFFQAFSYLLLLYHAIVV